MTELPFDSEPLHRPPYTQSPHPADPLANDPNNFGLPPTGVPVLDAVGLYRAYGPTIALAGVDLVVTAGQSVAIMGPSGSGKSTLLHALAGIERPDSGTVTFTARNGVSQDIASMGETERAKLRRSSFGFVFQSGLLIPELTAIENVAMALMINGVGKSAALSQAAQWLSALGLAGMEERRIGQLSGGQAQRVAIARAQVTGAQVIFADEPTGALDQRTGSEVLGILLDTTVGRGHTLVMVTHDQNVAARCDRVVHLLDGKIVSNRTQADQQNNQVQS